MMMKYEYTNSGIEWIGEIPKHWKFERLKDLVELRNEKTDEKTDVEDYLELEDIEKETGKIINYRSSIEVASKVTVFEKGDVLFGKLRPYLNKHHLTLKNGKCTGEILAFNCRKINNAYFKYCISSPGFIVLCSILSTGAKMPRIDYATQLAYFYLPFPPKPEQIAIAAYLDKACSGIDRVLEIKRQQIEKIEEFFLNRIFETTTKGLNNKVKQKPTKSAWINDIPEHWEIRKVKRLAKIFRGKFTHRPRNDERLYNGVYPFIQTGSVTNAKKYVTEYQQTLNEWGKSVSELFPSGTLTMTIAANIADVAILNFDACFPDSIVGFKPYHFMELEYLYYLFIALKQDFLSTAIVTTQMNLNVVRVGDVEGFIPPQNEQIEIIAYLNELAIKTDYLKNKIEAQIETLQTYKKSLIHEVVTGKKQVCDLI
jgi:type I restriction enzyme S subunit